MENNYALELRRYSSDGDIAVFRKDSTAVGSIGSYAGQHLRVGSGETNLLFASPSEMVPSTSSGAVSNGLIDLGSGGRRFKDLYLSGGVDFGAATGGTGTSTSNKLDDYEEGTWTPSPSGGAVTIGSARYVKVGQLVTCSYDISVSTGGGQTMTSLPFTAKHTVAHALYTSAQDFPAGTVSPTGIVGGGTTTYYWRVTRDNLGAIGMSLTTGAIITCSFSYMTDS